jgi:hypothetical protein
MAKPKPLPIEIIFSDTFMRTMTTQEREILLCKPAKMKKKLRRFTF